MWIERNDIFSFYFLAYLYSWAIGAPLALQARRVIPVRLPYALHYLTAFGPALAALTINMALRRRVLRSAPVSGDRTRCFILWLGVGFMSPLLLFGVAKFAGRVLGQPTPDWTSLGEVNFLPGLGLGAWLLWFLTNGLGEEIGWRGFALPRLQQTYSAFASSILLSIAWAGWHLPAFFYVPSYTALGLRILPAFFIGILAGAIVLTWLYNSSGGNLMAVVLWHASFNFVSASPNASGLAAAITSTLVIVWAAALLWRCGRKTLMTRSVSASRLERRSILPGDDLIPDAFGSLTHAITIRSSRHQVWKWLVQMGAGRAGWYSYDFIDNGRERSAKTIRPELQTIKVGEIMPALPGATDGFVVVAYELERFLTIAWRLPDGVYQMTWTFVLEGTGSDSTRLIVRARGGRSYNFYGLPWWIASLILPPVHFIMQRKQLVGIARRAEDHSSADA
jgi:membrane protease YdiL (CAAX protease family)